MAYRKKTKRVEVSLKGHANEEFREVTAFVCGRTLNEYLELMGYIEDADDDRSGAMRQLEKFADSLLEWNIEEEDGTPTPPTRGEFFKLDPDLGFALATEWLELLGGKVDAPLPDSSPTGEPSPAELALPMEPLSDHQPPTAVPA